MTKKLLYLSGAFLFFGMIFLMFANLLFNYDIPITLLPIISSLSCSLPPFPWNVIQFILGILGLACLSLAGTCYIIFKKKEILG